MIFGSFSAAVHGVALPSVMIIFGDTVQSLVTGTTQNDSASPADEQFFFDQLEDELTTQAYYYCGMAAGVLLFTYLQVRKLTATVADLCIVYLFITGHNCCAVFFVVVGNKL